MACENREYDEASAWADEEGTLAEIAQCDVGSEAESPNVAAELSFDEKVDVLGTAVVRHPLNREVLYEALCFCKQEQQLRDVEEFIAALPQFRSATQNPFHMLTTLEHAGGLEKIERDEAGRAISPEEKADLTEDEADDLVASISYKTTEVGSAFIEAYSPRTRLVRALSLAPERTKDYCEVLEFVKEAPRTYKEITDLLAGRPTLETVIDGRRETMQPSVFVDKLERAGALVWRNGWCLSEAGADFLREMKEAK